MATPRLLAQAHQTSAARRLAGPQLRDKGGVGAAKKVQHPVGRKDETKEGWVLPRRYNILWAGKTARGSLSQGTNSIENYEMPTLAMRLRALRKGPKSPLPCPIISPELVHRGNCRTGPASGDPEP
eukprot:1146738-Pelagomonas_calceolata.AAC.1